MKNRLLGELIGLARATDGNEHLINPAATAVVIKCLAAAESLNPSALGELLGQVEEEKRNMVPDCFLCAHPCSKNSAHDMSLLQEEEPEHRDLKEKLLSELQKLAAKGWAEDERLYYKTLIAVGIAGIDLQILESLLRQIQKHL
ncbi:MAG: hypothetical protein IKB09_04480 [Oscillospiraceae bacterium]|nr:hypothetical protein [Oscillospiraceae bacterium]